MTFDKNAAPAEMLKAVRSGDNEAAIKLLQDAGGACGARDLAKRAHEESKKYDSHSGVPRINYSLAINGDKTETLTLILSNAYGGAQTIGSLRQSECLR